MKKLYLMIDDTLAVCIVVDRCVVSYREYLYTESILDQLYSQFISHNFDEATVVVKGILTEQVFQESYQTFRLDCGEKSFSSYISKFDVNKILHCLKASGVEQVRVVDKFGYYIALEKKNCCMIDTLGNAFAVFTFLTSFRDVRDVAYNSYQNLEKVLLNCSKKYSIQDFIDTTTHVDTHLVSYFRNYKSLGVAAGENRSRVLATLGVFAYTELALASHFELDQNSINLVAANPIKREDDFSEGSGDFALTQNRASKERGSARNQQNRESDYIRNPQNRASKERGLGKKNSSSVDAGSSSARDGDTRFGKIVCTACIAASVAMFAGVGVLNHLVATNTEKVGLLSDENDSILYEIESANNSLANYQDFESNLSTFSNYADLYLELAKTNFGGSLKEGVFDGSTSYFKLYVKKTDGKTSDDSARDLNSVLSKKFTVQKILEENSDKDGYWLFAVYLERGN